jgi:hypothetical protein
VGLGGCELGMSDKLSITLGHEGHEVYKYVPYPLNLSGKWSVVVSGGCGHAVTGLRERHAEKLRHTTISQGLGHRKCTQTHTLREESCGVGYVSCCARGACLGCTWWQIAYTT